MQPQTYQLPQLLPGDLLALLRHEGILIAPESPLMGTPALAPGKSHRSAQAIWDEMTSDVDPPRLKAHLQALAAPATTIEMRRGIHRQPPSTFFVCAGTGVPASFSTVSIEPDGSCMLFLPESGEALVKWIVDFFDRIPEHDIALRHFPEMPPTSLTVVLVLADLFRELYPYPDREWRPDRAIRFRLGQLGKLLEDGLTGRDSSSLATAWCTLVGSTFPVPTEEQIKATLRLLASEGLVHEESAETGESVFEMGNIITWAIRCMAWWDLDLTLRLWSASDSTPSDALAVIQATGIWQWRPAFPAQSQPVELEMISGAELEIRVRTFLGDALGEPQVFAAPV